MEKSIKKIEHRCDVCDGQGTVWNNSLFIRTVCNKCGGTGKWIQHKLVYGNTNKDKYDRLLKAIRRLSPEELDKMHDFFDHWYHERNKQNLAKTEAGHPLPIYMVDFAGYIHIMDAPYYEAVDLLDVHKYPYAEKFGLELIRRYNLHTKIAIKLESIRDLVKSGVVVKATVELSELIKLFKH